MSEDDWYGRPARKIAGRSDAHFHHRPGGYEPEQDAADRGLIVQTDRVLPVLAYIDFRTRTVQVSADLDARERRSALAHEVAHDDRGPVTSFYTPREERAVEELAAVRLIPFDELVEAIRSSDSIDEVAFLLDVDYQTVAARLRTLTAAEYRKVEQAMPPQGMRIMRGRPLRPSKTKLRAFRAR